MKNKFNRCCCEEPTGRVFDYCQVRWWKGSSSFTYVAPGTIITGDNVTSLVGISAASGIAGQIDYWETFLWFTSSALSNLVGKTITSATVQLYGCSWLWGNFLGFATWRGRVEGALGNWGADPLTRTVLDMDLVSRTASHLDFQRTTAQANTASNFQIQGLKQIIQDIINDTDWNPAQGIGLFLKDNGSSLGPVPFLWSNWMQIDPIFNPDSKLDKLIVEYV